ncbi:lysozyme inhibitor LprI family protein [Serratia fonticola]
MKITNLSILSLIIIGFSYQTSAASFDCTKAKSFAEKTICNDAKLSKDDDELKYAYGKAKASVQDRRAFAEITKTLWNSRERCSDYACVKSWYDTAFEIYSSIAKVGIPETNGQSDIVAGDEKTDDRMQNGIESQGGDVKVIKPKITHQLENEAKFISLIKKAMKESDNVKNKMQLGGIKAARDKSICELLKVKSISNWIGEVKNISANSDGKGVLTLELTNNLYIRTWNNSFSDIGYETLMEPGTNLFNAASNLNPGDVVYFSGTFFDDNEGCIAESSLSLSGKVKEPEFIFKFSDIKKYQ